ncbi:PTS system mannose-specific EIIAB component [bioreactor metagenome]|uniref:PTS system mannose-specific EIIAB component n=1 Tax=bioreactor metagenome TaxID=1076179 RepID=A0A645GTC9_9ZZZZ
MLGIVLISHGKMAEGMVDSAKLFFGETIEQLAYVTLRMEDNPDDFQNTLTEAIKEVDGGEGVIVLADLLGGTPSNRAAYLASENVQVITGMNLTMFLELLGLRLSGAVDINSLIETGQNGIVSLNNLLLQQD